jgi:hypothetical protein
MISFRVSLLPFTDLLSRPDAGSARKLISQHARLNMGALDVSEPPASYVMVGRRLAIWPRPPWAIPLFDAMYGGMYLARISHFRLTVCAISSWTRFA